MHRATPLNTSFRAYVAGGSRATVPGVDDSKLMQESNGNFMSNEQRSGIESPQNFGFTSVVMDADKNQDGSMGNSAESFVQFMGGNRSFPVFGNMDDRRHRLKELAKGDSAMFSTKGRKQQFHMTSDGGFWTAPRDKTVRMALIDEDSEQDGQQQQGGGGTSSTGSGSGGQQQLGQTSRYSDNQKSKRYMEVTKDKTRISGDTAHMAVQDTTLVHANSDNNVYLGAEAGKGSFDFLVTISGVCVNSKGKIG